MHRQRDAVREMTAETDVGGEEGEERRGSRWEKMRSGALGRGRRMARNGNRARTGDAELKRKPDRRHDRGQTESVRRC